MGHTNFIPLLTAPTVSSRIYWPAHTLLPCHFFTLLLFVRNVLKPFTLTISLKEWRKKKVLQSARTFFFFFFSLLIFLVFLWFQDPKVLLNQSGGWGCSLLVLVDVRPWVWSSAPQKQKWKARMDRGLLLLLMGSNSSHLRNSYLCQVMINSVYKYHCI